MLVSGYYGLLRIGEMALTECGHFINYADVHVSCARQCILMVLRSSKTHSVAETPQIIKIYDSGGEVSASNRFKYCPYHIIYDFIALRSSIK